MTEPYFGQVDMFPHHSQLTGWVHCWFWSLQGFFIDVKKKEKPVLSFKQ